MRVSSCVCAVLAGFSKCFGIRLHEDRSVEKGEKKSSKAESWQELLDSIIIGKAGSN